MKTELNKNEMELANGGELIADVKDYLCRTLLNPVWNEPEKSPAEPDFMWE